MYRFVLFLLVLLNMNCSGLSPADFQAESIVSSDLAEDEEGIEVAIEALLIYILDVGQGDATLVLGPEINGKRVSLLIDAGALSPDGGDIISELLESLHIYSLDYFVLSHFDGDHMGGTVTVGGSRSLFWQEDCTPLGYFPTTAVIDLGDSDKDTESVAEYLDCRDSALSRFSTKHVVVGDGSANNIGYEIDLKGGYSATVVAGNGYVLGRDDQAENVDKDNEESIAMLIQGTDDFSFLVTGDLTGNNFSDEDALVETVLANALEEEGIEVSVLRAGHHGSATASSEDFLSTLNPLLSLISVGDNSYGHPNCDSLNNLHAYSEHVIQTGEGSTEDACAVLQNSWIADDHILISVMETGYMVSTEIGFVTLLGDFIMEIHCEFGIFCEEIIN
jgi:competence protein ComEC